MFEKLLRATLVVCVVLMLAPAAQAGTITVGDPLIPTGLLVGNTFHIAFQTEGTSTAATSTDIAYYNAHVQASANSAGSLFLGRGWNWYCIGSTSTVDARDNAVVSAPVYIESKGNSSTNPLTQILVANNYTDFWDGNHAQSIYQDNDGVHGNYGPWVLTLHFRRSGGEGKQGPKERPEFVFVGGVRQSGEELFFQHFTGNRAAAVRMRGTTVGVVPGTRSAIGQLGLIPVPAA